RCRSEQAPASRARDAVIRNSETAAPNSREQLYSTPHKPPPADRLETRRLRVTKNNFGRARETRRLSRNRRANWRVCIGGPGIRHRTVQTRISGGRDRVSPKRS